MHIAFGNFREDKCYVLSLRPRKVPLNRVKPNSIIIASIRPDSIHLKSSLFIWNSSFMIGFFSFFLFFCMCDGYVLVCIYGIQCSCFFFKDFSAIKGHFFISTQKCKHRHIHIHAIHPNSQWSQCQCKQKGNLLLIVFAHTSEENYDLTE